MKNTQIDKINRQQQRARLKAKIKRAFDKTDPIWILILSYLAIIAIVLLVFMVLFNHKVFH